MKTLFVTPEMIEDMLAIRNKMKKFSDSRLFESSSVDVFQNNERTTVDLLISYVGDSDRFEIIWDVSDEDI